MIPRNQVDIKNLLQVASTCLQKNTHLAATVACILTDISPIVHRQNKKDHVIKITCVDQFVNCSTSFGAMCNYLSLFISTNKQNQIKNIGKVGDVLLLDKNIFYLWSGMTLQSKYTSTFDKIITLDWQTLEPIKFFGRTQNMQILKQKNVIRRIQHLRKWFNQNVNQFFQPKIGIVPNSTFSLKQQPFNMLLRYYNHLKDPKFRQFGDQTVILHDGESKNYFWFKIQPLKVETIEKIQEYEQEQFNKDQKIQELSQSQRALKPLMKKVKKTRIVKQIKKIYPTFKEQTPFYVKDIKKISKNKEIQFKHDQPCYLTLPMTFKCDSFMNYIGYFAGIQKKTLLMDNKEIGSQLTHFIERQHNLVPTFLKVLLQHQNKYELGKKKQNYIVDSRFMLSAVLVYWTGQLRLYHNQYEMFVHDDFLYSVSQLFRKEVLKPKKLCYVFEGTLGVIDRSNIGINGANIFKIELFAFDKIGTFYDQKMAEQLNKKIGTSRQLQQKAKLMKHISQRLNQLVEQSSHDNPVKLMVESIKSKKLLFRLVNTKIYPQGTKFNRQENQ